MDEFPSSLLHAVRELMKAKRNAEFTAFMESEGEGWNSKDKQIRKLYDAAVDLISEEFEEPSFIGFGPTYYGHDENIIPDPKPPSYNRSGPIYGWMFVLDDGKTAWLYLMETSHDADSLRSLQLEFVTSK